MAVSWALSASLSRCLTSSLPSMLKIPPVGITRLTLTIVTQLGRSLANGGAKALPFLPPYPIMIITCNNLAKSFH
jgi:hypothetical protein